MSANRWEDVVFMSVVVVTVGAVVVAPSDEPPHFDLDCGDIAIIPVTGGSAECEDRQLLQAVQGGALRVRCACEESSK